MKRSVLIVEDDRELRNVMVEDFTRKGYDVRDAENGSAAFDLFRERPAELVITDGRMPGGDGNELIERLMGLGSKPAIMIVSGYNDLKNEEVFDRGALAVFTKPFNRRQLFQTVERALKPLEERFSVRPDGLEGAPKLVVKGGSLAGLFASGKLASGRGGLFVSHEGVFPELEKPLTIRIEVAEGAAIEALGIVRWVRDQGVLVLGFGFEPVFAEPASRAELIRLLESSTRNCFIPRHPDPSAKATKRREP